MIITERWRGTSRLLEHREAWDDLWQRSAVTVPTARAESVVSYVETFSSADSLQSIVVREDSAIIAALPLVPRRRAGFLHCLGLPHNDWTTGAAPLVDRRLIEQPQRASEVATELARAFMSGPQRAIFLDGLHHDVSFWRMVETGLQQIGGYAQWEARASIAMLPIERFHSDPFSHLSKNARKNLRRAARRLAQRGSVSLRVITPSSMNAHERRWLDQALEIEHHKSDRPGWTSIIAAGLRDFFHQQADIASRRGEFLLSFLELDHVPIAFEYGWLAKQVYHSLKVGYEPAFRSYSAGHILMARLGQYLAKRGDVTAVDCLCRSDTALAKTWKADAYPVYRLWACRPAWLGQTLAWGLKQKQFLTGSVAPQAAMPSPL